MTQAERIARSEVQYVLHGDCVDVMRGMEPDSIDAVVTDPPYHLTTGKTGGPVTGYMRKVWDGTGIAFDPAMWAEALRVMKPGGYLVAFGGRRTYHRLTCAIEDAGYEIRDCILWLYGSGFPKSRNLGDGRGTALRPGWEPCVLARKPLVGTLTENVERYGTGAINIGACRFKSAPRLRGTRDDGHKQYQRRQRDGGRWRIEDGYGALYRPSSTVYHRYRPSSRRWPTNVILDEEAAAMLDAQSCQDAGGPSRFFYTTKAPKSEREAWGRLTLPAQRRTAGGIKDQESPYLRTSPRINDHPTVKPLALMEWLIRLVTPPGGIILDPFCGSGSTLVAAKRLRVRAIGIEQDERSVEIARQRIAAQWEVQLL